MVGRPGTNQAWRESHQALVDGRSNRRLLVALESAHGIPHTEPNRILEAGQLLLTLESAGP